MTRKRKRTPYEQRYRDCTEPFRPQGDVYTGTDMDALVSAIPYPQDGDTFGSWVFNADTLTLSFEPNGHWLTEIDLERCVTGAVLCDSVFQKVGKSYMSAQDLGDMLKALDVLLHPQGTLCSCGNNRTLDATAWLKTHLKAKKACLPRSTSVAMRDDANDKGVVQ